MDELERVNEIVRAIEYREAKTKGITEAQG